AGATTHRRRDEQGGQDEGTEKSSEAFACVPVPCWSWATWLHPGFLSILLAQRETTAKWL
ncbi:MAG: hypothetical protein WAL99_16025, partial [Pseudonocardiaceae bacterium]